MARYPKEPYSTYKNKIKKMGGKEFFSEEEFYKSSKRVRNWNQLRARKHQTKRTRDIEEAMGKAGIKKRKMRD